MTATAFSFDECADADACRAGIRPLLAPGMTWSEVHCGRCGKTGIVRHADLVPALAAAPEPAPEVEAPSEPETESVAEAEAPRASGKGSGR
ncbi:hypothetical protein ASG63_08875 [Methylobacterium sp. Leaf94]|uniref:hypothetical protein n=1 Tax=Methylobacterium sp. Leaf94 TaxID=1736250 RepID=UPI00070100A6|nr:hypothetical protein [Methylobacterium sp. Leaf94]KQU17609.1 hypothetical protein ASG63_08875 [Methylobacterium sp. Leaf94]